VLLVERGEIGAGLKLLGTASPTSLRTRRADIVARSGHTRADVAASEPMGMKVIRESSLRSSCGCGVERVRAMSSAPHGRGNLARRTHSVSQILVQYMGCCSRNEHMLYCELEFE
jgi:hypothetical protein